MCAIVWCVCCDGLDTWPRCVSASHPVDAGIQELSGPCEVLQQLCHGVKVLGQFWLGLLMRIRVFSWCLCGFPHIFPKGEKLMEFYIDLLQTAASSPPRSMSPLPPSSILLYRELLKLCRSGTERWESPRKGRQMWEKITGLHRIVGERV